MNNILGDYTAFFKQQVDRLAELGISVAGWRVSHLAFRTELFQEYLITRQQLESHCSANVENVWNGRPISKVLLSQPIQLSATHQCDLIELIPPPHQAEYKMGLEHVGFALDEAFPAFERQFFSVFTGRQFQSEDCQPYYVRFRDKTNVKFYPKTLLEYCVSEGRSFDGIYHADNGTHAA
jgi:predicted metalloenzyme YecM